MITDNRFSRLIDPRNDNSYDLIIARTVPGGVIVLKLILTAFYTKSSMGSFL